MIGFDEILRMRQKELKHYLAGYLKKMGYDVIRQKGFLHTLTRYIRKSRVLSAVLKMDGI